MVTNPAIETPAAETEAYPSLISAWQFQQLRTRWRASLTGNNMRINSDDVYFTLSKLSGTAEDYMNDMKPTRLHIWEDLSPIHESVNFRKSYERLRTIAQSYSILGSIHYHDLNVQETIVQSLDFISAEIYNGSTVQQKTDNWWNYRIGAPLPLMDIAMLLYDDLSPRRRHEYGATVIKNVGSISQRSLKGANRADICLALIGAGILTNDEHQVARGRWGLTDRDFEGENSVFALVESGEGLYEGGSYISHEIFPYSGGYGVQHYYSLSKAVNVLCKSPYRINNTELIVTFNAVDTTFIPVMWRGMMMAHVRGRDIARKSEPDAFWGNLFLQALLYFSETETVPWRYKKHFKTLARSIYEAGPLPDLYGLNITQSFGIQRVIEENMTAAEPPIGTFATPMSDRLMHHRQNWSAALAMSSSRIGRYEALNNENLQPWYQGDGFLYVYTDRDPLHFSNDYWPTMDPYHSPGVTNGQNIQAPPSYKFTAHRDWAGGLDWKGEIGLAGLDALSTDKGSWAKKSWFFLLNSIIALGAGCAGISGSEVHTTIESRNLPLGGSNFSINGEYQTMTPGWIRPWQSTRQDARWAHLESFGGYVFLDDEPTTFKHEKRQGKWTDINKYPDYLKFDDVITREYITIYRNHGKNPKDGHYAYALLPNANMNETLDFATALPVNVTHNTPRLQAIQFNNTVMANFWSGGTIGHLTAVTPCSITWGYSGVEDMYITISVSDPTQKATRIVLFLSDPDIGGVADQDDTITLRWSRPGEQGAVTITINVEGSRGKTHRLSFDRVSFRGVRPPKKGKKKGRPSGGGRKSRPRPKASGKGASATTGSKVAPKTKAFSKPTKIASKAAPKTMSKVASKIASKIASKVASKQTKTKLIEVEPTQMEPVETEIPEATPAETESPETELEETEPAEAEPTETEPVELETEAEPTETDEAEVTAEPTELEATEPIETEDVSEPTETPGVGDAEASSAADPEPTGS
ncbi:Chondroitinase-AC [Dactylella cylindrospora]|nr:Chondroitinase-AC [Dactylella cylindrospora]